MNEGSSCNIFLTSFFDTHIHLLLDVLNQMIFFSNNSVHLIFSQDLMKDLKSELSKNLERLIIGLMLTPAEFDAKMMRKAMEVQLRNTWLFVVNCWAEGTYSGPFRLYGNARWMHA